MEGRKDNPTVEFYRFLMQRGTVNVEQGKVTAITPHENIIAECGENKTFKWIEGQIVWLNPLPDNLEKMPELNQLNIFTVLVKNKNLTYEQTLQLITRLFELNYQQFCLKFLEPELLNMLSANQQYFQAISLDGKDAKSYYGLVNAIYAQAIATRRFDLLMADCRPGQSVEAVIWEKLAAVDHEYFFRLLQRFNPDTPKLLRFIKQWFDKNATIEESLATVRFLQTSAPKTSLEKHLSLLVKMAKQKILNILLDNLKNNNLQEIQGELERNEFYILFSEHRNSIIHGGYGQAESVKIWHKIQAGDYGAAKRLYDHEESVLQLDYAKVVPEQVAEEFVVVRKASI